MTQKKDRIFSFENLNIQTGISLGASPEKTQRINIAFSWTTFLTIFSSCIKFAAQKSQQYVTHRSKSNRLEYGKRKNRAISLSECLFQCSCRRLTIVTWRDTAHFDSEDDYRTGCRNVTHCQQQRSYSGLRSPGRSSTTYFWNDSWVQTFHSFNR